MEKFEVKIEKNQKIREFLLNYGFSKSETNKILKNKDVKCEGKRLDEQAMLSAGQVVTIFASEKPKDKFKILFEDENVVVIDKQQGIETQGPQSLEKSLGAIAVHRLDRNTSGVMIFAKNSLAEEALKKAFKDKNVEKKYVCEVIGAPNFKGEVFVAYLVKEAQKSQVKIFRSYVQNSFKIETKLTTVKKGEQTSVVVCEPLTGRTHQIRAHLAFLGYPILGDGKYGNNQNNKKFKENFQKLHCFSLKIKKISKNFEYLQNKAFICKPAWAEKII